MKKIFAAIALFGSMLTMSGCSDYLDILPKDKQTSDMFWKSREDVEAVLGQSYHLLRGSVKDMLYWGELRGGSVNTSETDPAKIQDFQILPNNKCVKWANFYNVIGLANAVLHYAPGVMGEDESYKEEQMKSNQTEAYFLRALSYFYLVRNFRDVPLITEPYIDDQMPTDVAKSSESEVITQIKKDITDALATNAAKETYTEAWENKGRATKWALYALMADVCLWSEDYDGCITYADNLINATASIRPVFMSSSAQWFTMFYPGNSNESIFEIQFDGNLDQTSGGPTDLTYWNAAPVKLYFSETMTERLQDPETRASVRGIYGTFGYDKTATTEVTSPVIWKYNGMGDEWELKREGDNQDANFIVYRMADVMLMKAEALIRKGGTANWQEALDLIGQTRTRAGMTTPLGIDVAETSELDLLNALLEERDLEFAAEGKRWYDLLRLGRQQNFKYKSQFIDLVMTNNTTANRKWLSSTLSNDDAWFLPIPEWDIQTNKLLVQNPYYDVVQ